MKSSSVPSRGLACFQLEDQRGGLVEAHWYAAGVSPDPEGRQRVLLRLVGLWHEGPRPPPRTRGESISSRPHPSGNPTLTSRTPPGSCRLGTAPIRLRCLPSRATELASASIDESTPSSWPGRDQEPLHGRPGYEQGARPAVNSRRVGLGDPSIGAAPPRLPEAPPYPDR